ncbi:hypothetical protein J8J14_02890 [Roseomonas sp. SSH11]|uniref:Uncharacterized protein n=1 Tax=Pararoseomonas baculiformis TaxID=2820812 RepID=A0ABS4A9Q1_9PROT|nr:hypothetical protein [Pararoseomonas baculiformis]MBP0443714.1 hypothetical protein [Pararoseomonas baculiformis]
MQRHPTYDDPFRRRGARPGREAAVGRFAEAEMAPWDPSGPPDEWTEDERKGAAVLRAVRLLLWLTVVGAIAALAVGLWRVFLGE